MIKVHPLQEQEVLGGVTAVTVETVHTQRRRTRRRTRRRRSDSEP